MLTIVHAPNQVGIGEGVALALGVAADRVEVASLGGNVSTHAATSCETVDIFIWWSS